MLGSMAGCELLAPRRDVGCRTGEYMRSSGFGNSPALVDHFERPRLSFRCSNISQLDVRHTSV